jgi:sterol desaturase/sphingolipid hydroxylase (fatty acid hydroxylase superfamily)
MDKKDNPLDKVVDTVVSGIKAPVKITEGVIAETTGLMSRDGELKPGEGKVTGVIALGLAMLSFLAVLCFHYPQYLTTPEVRHHYSVDTMRYILSAALIVSGLFSVFNVVFNRSRKINLAALAIVGASMAWGGSKVPVGNFPTDTPYIGLDWFILSLLASTMIFMVIEKIFPLYKNQVLFRREWQTDLKHFAFNHFIVGLVLLITNFLLHHFFSYLVNSHFQQFVAGISFLPQLFLCALVADLMEYGTHRAYHEVPFLWKFHSVHHSIKTIDWLAGSRQHICELLCTRIAVLAPLYICGFSQSVMNTYIIIIGFQAVFNHANVHINWGPLKYIFVTPQFHHWHHASDDEAIDRNYASTFSFIDYLFGTAVKVPKGKEFPEKYGVVGDYVPDGFLKQQAYPFKSSWQDIKDKVMTEDENKE